jgi:hypothetical protein
MSLQPNHKKLPNKLEEGTKIAKVDSLKIIKGSCSYWFLDHTSGSMTAFNSPQQNSKAVDFLRGSTVFKMTKGLKNAKESQGFSENLYKSLVKKLRSMQK